MKLWRDLEIGELIEVGDRCCGENHEWIIMNKERLYMHREIDSAFVRERE